MEYTEIKPRPRTNAIEWLVHFFPTAGAQEASVVVEAMEMEEAEWMVESWFPGGFVSYATPLYLE